MTISSEEWEKKKTKSKDEGFTLTIANAVFKYLNALVDDRSKRRTRWIWELLQNAHDASTVPHKRLIASIRDNSEELVFLHNGSGFTIEQIQRLIFHGSTKVEDEETIGQYGSGFLTTHLLSWDIDVSGQLDDDQWFDFRLSRNPESVDALSTSMNQAWDDFKPVSSLREPMPGGFTTRFKYPITEMWAKDAVKEGNTRLKQCAPFVVVFNKAFYSIDIKEPREISSFKVVQRCLSIRSGLWEISVIQSINENQTGMKYLLGQGEKSSVAVRMRSTGVCPECLSVENIPRLFVAVPLMGTESFSFPAVINGNRKFFKPNENRDGVDLGQGEEDSDSDTNRNNQAVIEEACTLLVRLLEYAASKGWSHVYRWTKVLTIQGNEWLKGCIEEKFIKNVLQTDVILTKSDKVITPKDAVMPLPKSAEGVDPLWDLLNDWPEYCERLPRRDEAIGWWKTIESWMDMDGIDSSVFDGAIDDSELASRIEECSCLDDLQSLLRKDVCPVDWLNRFYEFLMIYRSDAVIDDYALVPNQIGEFTYVENLHRDKNIDDELKEIAELLDWSLREELRDPQLKSLEDEVGAGDLDNENVVRNLIDKLQERADSNPDNDFKKASTLLFTWIVNSDREDYSDLLLDVSVFTKDGESHHSLRNTIHNGETLLAPVCSWPEDLQECKDIFPPDRILADDFFKEMSDPKVWKRLDKEGHLVRGNMIINDEKIVNSEDFLLVDELDEDGKSHESSEEVFVTNIVERVEIMRRVKGNSNYAPRFWKLVTGDVQGLEIKKAMCTSCEVPHEFEYYPAEWLMRVREDKWIRGKDRGYSIPNAPSLAQMLRDNKLELKFLTEDPVSNKLMEIIDVQQSDLRLEFIAEDKEKRDEVINVATTLYDSPQLVQHIQDNENLPQNLEKILEATGGDLSQVVEDIEEHQEQQRRMAENQDLGRTVEKWVGDILDELDENFKVTSVHKGADFKITVIQGNRKWWIEVKSTREQSVKMSSDQTKAALDEKEQYLLCVVPIPENIKPDLETVVRKNMLFIKNIGEKLGKRVATLCKSTKEQETVLANTLDDTPSGIELDFEKGKVGIRVNHSVWKDEGFPLEDLTKHLK